MPNSTLSQQLAEELQEFVWNEWAQMGVLAHVREQSPWAQDPEALLLLSLEVGRDDPRLFGEVLDWWDRNRQLISRRRLRSLTLDEYDDRLLTGALTRERNQSPTPDGHARDWETPEVLFRGLGAPTGQLDQAFVSVGLLAAPIELSGKSRSPDLIAPINLAFRLRQLLGVGVKAEVLRLLLTTSVPQANAPALASAAGYHRRNVQEALSSLTTAGFLTMTQRGSDQRYSLDRQTWASFLSTDSKSLIQDRDWVAISAALRRFLRWEQSSDAEKNLSDYMHASRTRTFLEELQPLLAQAGIRVDSHAPLDAAHEALEQVARELLGLLRPASHADPTLGRGWPAHLGANGSALELETMRERADGQWGWKIRARNGRIVAVSTEPFASQEHAANSARSVRDIPQQLDFEILEKDGRYSWEARAANRALVARSPDDYSSSFNARRALERLQRPTGQGSPNQRHVLPTGDGWAVHAAGASRASAHTATQKEAVKRARDIVANHGGGEVVIHGRDGRIRNKDTVSPGNDPHPPKG